MFLEYYRIHEQPFGETPDERFLYLSKTHGKVLASLLYGFKMGRGFMALIAEPGMGKTTLLHQILATWQRGPTVFLFQTQCNARELLRYMLMDLGVENPARRSFDMNTQLNNVLLREAHAGRSVALFIDEAQNLTPSVLETVRLLSNFETPSSKLLHIVLCGQPQLADKLAQPRLAQLSQRISIISRLDRLTPEETNGYIDHRLKVAGYSGVSLFTRQARAMISQQAEGIPRNINKLCFHALSLGCALNQKVINASVMEEVFSDLKLRSPSSTRRSPRGLQPQTLGRVAGFIRRQKVGGNPQRDGGGFRVRLRWR